MEEISIIIMSGKEHARIGEAGRGAFAYLVTSEEVFLAQYYLGIARYGGGYFQRILE